MNALANETSPYLLQHADNPVAWYPWGPEALERARSEQKPILLSVGYSACHWCHVMAHESFEDEATAALMNEHFVNIKVDREERPDLDKIYQVAHNLLSGRNGGWPLTMFLTPGDHTPFFGGTYFPREPHYGLPSFKEVLVGVARFFREHPEDARKQGEALRQALNERALP
ncbi:MAG: thioredoxin domain-containing protein, partial [Beggiatoa sp.]|nr:thioredoxin domain-containing protein [Beggiatoa sp.]